MLTDNWVANSPWLDCCIVWFKEIWDGGGWDGGGVDVEGVAWWEGRASVPDDDRRRPNKRCMRAMSARVISLLLRESISFQKECEGGEDRQNRNGLEEVTKGCTMPPLYIWLKSIVQPESQMATNAKPSTNQKARQWPMPKPRWSSMPIGG